MSKKIMELENDRIYQKNTVNESKGQIVTLKDRLEIIGRKMKN